MRVSTQVCVAGSHDQLLDIAALQEHKHRRSGVVLGRRQLARVVLGLGHALPLVILYTCMQKVNDAWHRHGQCVEDATCTMLAYANLQAVGWVMYAEL